MSIEPLNKTLDDKIRDRLVALETLGRPTVRDDLVSLLNPSSPQAAAAATDASARVEEIRAILASRDLYPWVHPLLSAIAFEAIYGACVHTWLLVAKPEPPDDIAPPVAEYIAFQVKAFCMAIGADRVA
jgi:hypothetical protein